MLDDRLIAAAVPTDAAYKLADQQSMYLHVSPTGAKSFRLKYRFQKREKLLTLGRYPFVDLHEARRRADVARRQLADGIEPKRWHIGADAPPSMTLAEIPVPAEGARFVYFVRASTGHIKIGLTSNPEHRILDLQTSHAEPLLLLAAIPGGHAPEREVHRMFAGSRDRGEWFSPTPPLEKFVRQVAEAGQWPC
ncbi:integrase arm-type DNA-binding domain-containing protein [Sphingomonas sp. UYP23]